MDGSSTGTRLAEACPDHPGLVLQPVADQDLKGGSADPIVAIDITDRPVEEWDRRAMDRQFPAPRRDAIDADSTAVQKTARIIGFVRPNSESSKR